MVVDLFLSEFWSPKTPSVETGTDVLIFDIMAKDFEQNSSWLEP